MARAPCRVAAGGTLPRRRGGAGAEGEGWCSLNADGHSIVMWQGNKPAVMLGFDGADLAAAKATLAQRGVTTSELMDHPGGKHFELTDPDGNLIMISSNNQ